MKLSLCFLLPLLSQASPVWTQWDGSLAKGHLTVNNVPHGFCDPTAQSYSGYFEIDAETDKNYFYWAFDSKNDPANDPVVLWMTGGPGCSSQLALLAENGPCTIDDDLNTVPNKYSWNNNATLVYVDQPAGTGFSYAEKAGYDSNEAEVSEDMLQFLLAFYEKFPNLKDNEFYIFGESYGGHYVPSVAHRVWEENQKTPGTINLKGMSVGNGLTDPEIQYAYYPEYAYNFTLEKLGKPVISLEDYEQMMSAVPKCISLIKKCQTGGELVCNLAQASCNTAMLSAYSQTGLNTYDIRKPCVGQLCYDFSNIDKWLTLPETLKALNVSSKSAKWAECNFDVNKMFSADWMKNYHEQIVDLLADDIRVLIYAGDCDFICNFLGNKKWTLELDWDGKVEFQNAVDTPWMVDGAEAGLSKSYEGFTFLQVYDAGHMVPMDQGHRSLVMLNMFIQNVPFPKSELK